MSGHTLITPVRALAGMVIQLSEMGKKDVYCVILDADSRAFFICSYC